MIFDEEWKLNRKVKKEEKKVVKDEKLAETLTKASETRSDLTKRSEKARDKVATEQWYSQKLDRHQLNQQIREARQNLFVQRDKLLRRMINFNNERDYILAKPNTEIKKRELARCSTGSKNAAYALAIVENAIDRLDDISTEREWHEIMSDLTKGYKTINAISIGSDLMTRLAFWIQKAKMEIKGDISIHAMEHYYGKPIDELLEQEDLDEVTSDIQKIASQMLVKDEALDLNNTDDILEAVRWGSIFVVQPGDVANCAEEQSANAKRTGRTGIYSNPGETYRQPSQVDMDNALDKHTV